MDQVPLPFASDHGRTLNPKGAKSCRIAGPNTSGLEKRQATLQLWICAEPSTQPVKPTIIFRGSRGPKSKLPWVVEKALYVNLNTIRVAFQPNAWADELFCADEILKVAADLESAGIDGEVLVGMDNHSAQRTPGMLELYTSLGMVPVFTAANCPTASLLLTTTLGTSFSRTWAEDTVPVWRLNTISGSLEVARMTSKIRRAALPWKGGC